MSLQSNPEQLMLTLINQDRAAAGLASLSFSDTLNDSSEDHSSWMLNTNTFDHTGAGGSTSQDRMAAAGYQFSGPWRSGENIAFQSERGAPGIEDDVADLYSALMNSPGHRANIMDPTFTQIGIGIETGAFTTQSGATFDSVMVTQNFAFSTAVNPAPQSGTPVGDGAPAVPDVVGPPVDVPDGSGTPSQGDTPVSDNQVPDTTDQSGAPVDMADESIPAEQQDGMDLGGQDSPGDMGEGSESPEQPMDMAEYDTPTEQSEGGGDGNGEAPTDGAEGPDPLDIAEGPETPADTEMSQTDLPESPGAETPTDGDDGTDMPETETPTEGGDGSGAENGGITEGDMIEMEFVETGERDGDINPMRDIDTGDAGNMPEMVMFCGVDLDAILAQIRQSMADDLGAGGNGSDFG